MIFILFISFYISYIYLTNVNNLLTGFTFY